MHIIERTYESLLADVASLSGFSEIRGLEMGLQWVLKEAPKLEKLLLATIETGVSLNLDEWPVSLHRIAKCSVWSAYALRLLRQLLLFGYKASVPHDNETTEKAFKGFLETNQEVRAFSNSLARVSPVLLDLARRHCQSVLYQFHASEITPRHGPGAVTTSKERWSTVFDSIEQFYPYSDYFSLTLNRDMLERWDSADRPSHITAKLIAVPKDSRGPRLICVHPAEAIWIQQGLRLELERKISRARFHKGPWPHGHVFFNDQSINGTIALLSSKSRRYATIDMKEASDRISDVLVQILFGRNYKYFGCCRAQKFRIPKLGSHVNLTGDLNCYAPMGNATTFPVQSLVFWSICVAALQHHGFHQPGAVFVFGDDIIIPSEATEIVINDLESFGLRVNRTKSFWRGAFRESCGVDAFNGVNITPVRWKTTVNAEDLLDLQPLSDMAMRLRMAGYEEAARTVYDGLNLRLRRHTGRQLFLTNNPDHGGVAEYRESDTGYSDACVWRDAYWHKSYQKYVSPVLRIEPSKSNLGCHDWNHVLESLVMLNHRKSLSELGGRSSVPNREAPGLLRPVPGWTEVK